MTRFNPIRAFDETVMGATYALVMWLWNRWQVRRIWPLRVALLATLFEPLHDRRWVGVVIFAVIIALEEFVAKVLPPRALAAAVASARESMPWRLVRPLFVASMLIFAIVHAAGRDALEVWGDVAPLAYVILSSSVVPTEPPRCRRREVAAGRLSRASA